jgi:anti-anti-sigma regulatory factor
MAHLDLTPLVREGFSLTPNLEGNRIVVQFAGNGDMEAVDPLSGYLKLVHREAVGLGVDRVSFDFSSLYFMNSSCFKAFVSLIDTVSRSDPRAYAVCFLTNPRIHWQRRSLEALRYLAPKVVEVEPLKS